MAFRDVPLNLILVSALSNINSFVKGLLFNIYSILNASRGANCISKLCKSNFVVKIHINPSKNSIYLLKVKRLCDLLNQILPFPKLDKRLFDLLSVDFVHELDYLSWRNIPLFSYINSSKAFNYAETNTFFKINFGFFYFSMEHKLKLKQF